MVVTLVLRLVDECLERGEVVGEAEHVSSGVCVPVRNAGDLVAFAREAVRERDEGRRVGLKPDPV